MPGAKRSGAKLAESAKRKRTRAAVKDGSAGATLVLPGQQLHKVKMPCNVRTKVRVQLVFFG